MASAIFTADDGTTTQLNDQAYTDAAVAAAVAAVPAVGEVVADVVVENTDGTTEKFDVAA